MKLKLTSTRPVPTANRHRLVRALASCWVANGLSLTDNDLSRAGNDSLRMHNDSLRADNDSSWTRNDPSCRHNESFSLHNNRAFSLVEVLVVVSLMSLIVLALMAVFTSTQRAFRASVTQSDVLEGSRAAMELMASDLRAMTPSDGVSNITTGPVNFFVVANSYGYSPLTQTLPGSSVSRTNLLNYFFVLGRDNTKWTATGYIVDTTSTSPLYPLYRYYGETNVANSPQLLVNQFASYINSAQFTNMSHLMDGVVHLTVHAYDTNGAWINNSVYNYTNAQNTYFLSTAYGEPQLYMYSNTVPASVELELGVLEDRVLARAESLPNNLPGPPPNDRRTLYLQGLSGNVHIFRQRVSIPNVDPTAYQ